jgi:hypothetical protein
MRARIVIAALVSAAAVVGPATAAAGNDRTGGSAGAYVNPAGDPTAVAGETGSTGHVHGSAGGAGCAWQTVTDGTDIQLYDVNGTPYSMTGRWRQYWCPGIGVVAVDDNFILPIAGADPRQLAADALAAVNIGSTAIRTSPSANGRLYVQVPTWLWLDNGWWHPYEATARAGVVWSTVRATPVEVLWSLGDGHTLVCRGPGTQWLPGLPEHSSGCTYTYRTSSAGQAAGAFRLQATATFAVSWSSNAATGGPLPAITRTSTVDVQVGEIQAIGTQGGR